MGGLSSKRRLIHSSGSYAHYRVARLSRNRDGAGHDGWSDHRRRKSVDAAKYQFMVLASIAALTLIADSIIMLIVYKRCFTAIDQYRPMEQ